MAKKKDKSKSMPKKAKSKPTPKKDWVIDLRKLPDYVREAVAKQNRKEANLRYRKKLRNRFKADWAALEKKLPHGKKKKAGEVIYVALPTKAEKARGKTFVEQKITTGRKVFAVYYDKKGNPKPIKEKGSPHYARPQTIKMIGNTPAYVLKKSYTPKFTSLFSVTDVDTGAVTEKYPCINGKNISWDKIVDEITDTLNYWMFKRFRQSDINFKLIIREVMVRDEAGKLYTFNDPVGIDFKKRALQKFKSGGLENFVSQTVYAHFAEMLSKEELVTTGSATYVWKHYNKGEEWDEREEWTDGTGSRWEKNDFEMVRLEHFCFDVQNMRIAT